MIKFLFRTIKKYFSKDLLEFLNHSKNYISGSLISKGAAFLLLPIITRLLTPEEYGIYEIYITLTIVISYIFTLGINSSVARYYFENENKFESFLGTNFVFVLILDIIISLIFVFFRNTISDFFSIRELIFLIALLTALFNSFFEIYLGYLQASKKSKLFSLLSSGQYLAIFALGIFFIFIFDEDKYFGLILSQLIVVFLLFGYSITSLLKLSNFELRWKYISYSLKYSLPLLPHILFSYVLVQFDKVIINQLLSKKETGLYSIAYRLGMIMSIFVMGMNKSWVPIFFENMKNYNFHSIKTILNKYTKIITILCGILIFFSQEILIFMTDPKFHSAAPVVPIVMFGYCFVFFYTICVNFLFYYKKTFWISINTIFSAIVNITLNYLLIPKYGYPMAALTTLLSYLITFFLNYIAVKRAFREDLQINILSLLKFIIIPFLSIVAYFVFYEYRLPLVKQIIIKTIIVTFLFIIFYQFKKTKLKKQSSI